MNKYLDPNQISTYAYKPLTGGAFSSPQILEQMIPKKYAGKKKAFLKEFKSKFKSFM